MIAPSRGVWGAGWFLALSYGLGAPLTAYAEYTGHALSQKFAYPPWFIYLTCAIQLACSACILFRRLAPWAAGALTVITLGAIVSHLRIASPATAVPAVVYTAIQIWYGLESRARPGANLGELT